MSKKQILTAMNVASQTLPFLMITATLVIMAFVYGNLEEQMTLHAWHEVMI